jgi:hypothetical protein
MLLKKLGKLDDNLSLLKKELDSSPVGITPPW